MKFVHFGDTHLGKKNFKIEEREKDFEKAFKQVIDFCLEKKVDFVIHSGDIVDTGRPQYKTVNFLVKQLKRLKKEKIPFFTIPGSHDVAPDGTIMSVLDRVGLLKNLGDRRYFDNKEDKIVLKGELFNGVFVAGVPGRRANIEEIYKRIVPEIPESEFCILIFHHIISDISTQFSDIPKSVLPKGFDYYAGGHWHKKFVTEFLGNRVVYPGSTETWNTREISKHWFCFYDNGDLEWVELDTREFEDMEVKADGITPKQLEEKTISKIKHSNGSILLIKFRGKLGQGTKAEINRLRILERARQNGYLHAVVYTADLKNPEDDFVQVENKSLEEIEKEYLESHEYSKKQIGIAMDLMDKFGRKMTSSESERQAKEYLEHLEENYEDK